MTRLDRYHGKRNVDRSGEPAGGKRTRGGARRFVIQEHDASSHHFDLRLEVAGVLRYWAIPKGPSTDPRAKRLAIETADHPLDYADFEGVIPPDAYGAGTVLLWDRGSCENLRASGSHPKGMEACLAEGLLEVWLAGEKLTGD